MIRRPPRSTQSRSSAASDVYKRQDNKILRTIIEKFGGGPVGLNTIATSVSEDPGTIEEVYEPFLIQEGFLQRTPRGREATELAYKHIGKFPPSVQGRFF